jgi:hypothetical protein
MFLGAKRNVQGMKALKSGVHVHGTDRTKERQNQKN